MATESGRQLVVAGALMVRVRGGAHYSGVLLGETSELGLCTEPVRVELMYANDDVRVAGYGQRVPADVRHQLASARVSMTLIHHDPDLLELVMGEAMAAPMIRTDTGLQGDFFPPGGPPGLTGPAGRLLGGRRPMYASGNRFVAVTLRPLGKTDNGREDRAWRFRKCHLSEVPTRITLGSECSLVHLTFRALPYAPPPASGTYSGRGLEEYASGAAIWDHSGDYMSGDLNDRR